MQITGVNIERRILFYSGLQDKIHTKGEISPRRGFSLEAPISEKMGLGFFWG